MSLPELDELELELDELPEPPASGAEAVGADGASGAGEDVPGNGNLLIVSVGLLEGWLLAGG